MPMGVATSGYKPGDIKAVAHGVIDPGFLACDGSAVSRAAYPALFAKIGTTWGAGDGATTFNLPNMLGRSPVGHGAGAGLTARTVGQAGGEENHLLAAAEMPVHNHPGVTDSQGAHAHTWAYSINGAGPIETVIPGTSPSNLSHDGDYSVTTAAAHAHNVTTNNAGGGGSHNNMHPFAVVLFQVKY